jgi:hypothetical protein
MREPAEKPAAKIDRRHCRAIGRALLDVETRVPFRPDFTFGPLQA